MISYHLHSSNFSTSNVHVTNVSIVAVDVLNEEVVLALRQKYPGITRVNLTKNVTTRGVNYRNGMILACGSTAGMPEFAEILQICLVGDELSFIVRLYFAWYQDHFRAFQLTLSPGREVALVHLEELTDTYPLVAYTIESRRMVTLKRHIIIAGMNFISYSAMKKFLVIHLFFYYFNLIGTSIVILLSTNLLLNSSLSNSLFKLHSYLPFLPSLLAQPHPI